MKLYDITVEFDSHAWVDLDPDEDSESDSVDFVVMASDSVDFVVMAMDAADARRGAMVLFEERYPNAESWFPQITYLKER